MEIPEGANVNLHNVGVTNFDTGFVNKGNLVATGSYFADNTVGIEGRDGSTTLTAGTYFNNEFADIAYEVGSEVEVINSYAQTLYNLTKGETNKLASEVTFIAHQLIEATETGWTIPMRRISSLLQELASTFSNLSRWAIKAMVGGLVYDVVKDMLEKFGITLPL